MENNVLTYKHIVPHSNNPTDYRGKAFTLPFPHRIVREARRGNTSYFTVQPIGNTRFITAAKKVSQ